MRSNRYMYFILSSALILCILDAASAQHSVARRWNEAHLNAVRRDLARPTVVARTLFHCAVAMYDAWAAYDSVAQTYLLGKTVGGFSVPFAGIAAPPDRQAAREEAVSYAAHRLLKHRFSRSPKAAITIHDLDSLFVSLGYDTSFTSTDYSGGSPAALGNYIGQSLIDFGLQDSSNEENNYAYKHYSPANDPLVVAQPGNPTLTDPNRWQPLKLALYIDQNGNVFPENTPKCVTPEWGALTPFAMTPADRTTHNRNGYDWYVYNDPGPPPLLDTLNSDGELSMVYKWAYSLVAVWSSHLKSSDTHLMDISPRSIGNNQHLPTTLTELQDFYNLVGGGDYGEGRSLNPNTGLPYEVQEVPRGDYARVLAEFWADGPSSETPPGHWFTILNYISDHPLFVKKFKGQGPVLNDLEWDVKAYFALGGAVHDAAIAAWGIKGWYDSARPISVIRWMADHGQCSDSTQPHFSRAGIPLLPGFIELVQAGDSLAGENNQNVDKIKLYAWRGPPHIGNPAVDDAGVGWILAENWYPYQRPTLVTPPFPGYVSGHSTYSRASAELLTLLTGDEYFPGGMGEFFSPKDHYLLFEKGPSVDVTLQWATYRDAADQCSLSRIWGGIHPPIDDIPGRLIGRKVGVNAFQLAEKYFNGTVTGVRDVAYSPSNYFLGQNYPNPFNPKTDLGFRIADFGLVTVKVYDVLGREVVTLMSGVKGPGDYKVSWDASGVSSGVYYYRLRVGGFTDVKKMLLLR